MVDLKNKTKLYILQLYWFLTVYGQCRYCLTQKSYAQY